MLSMRAEGRPSIQTTPSPTRADPAALDDAQPRLIPVARTTAGGRWGSARTARPGTEERQLVGEVGG